MKNIICSFSLMACLNVYAQTTTLVPTTSLCPGLQIFTGEWRYTNGIDTIRIYLRYHECYFTSTGTPELSGNLWGWHEYKKGSTIIESNYQYRFLQLPSSYDSVTTGKRHSILLVLPRCNFTGKRLLGSIIDFSQAREQKSVRATFDSTFSRIVWKQRYADGYGFVTGAKGMTLPKEFILIKQ